MDLARPAGARRRPSPADMRNLVRQQPPAAPIRAIPTIPYNPRASLYTLRDELKEIDGPDLPRLLNEYLRDKLRTAFAGGIPRIGEEFGGYCAGEIRPDGQTVPGPRQPLMDVTRPIIDRLIRVPHMNPEKLPPELVRLRYEHWILPGGYADRHVLTDAGEAAQLARLLHGRDPLTGSPIDWRTGKSHTRSSEATVFTSHAAIVWAEAMLWSSPEAQNARARAHEKDEIMYGQPIPAQRIFGPDFREYIQGWRLKEQKNGHVVVPLEFPDDTVICGAYIRARPSRKKQGFNGEQSTYWRLSSTYPCRPELAPLG